MNKLLTVVFDTNALISAAILKTSLSAQAFDLAVKSQRLIYSGETLIELADVIVRPKFDKYISNDDKNLFFNSFLINAYECEIHITVTDCRDPKDNKFLELAVDGKADYIVTGDKDLLILHPYKNISIVTPAQFLEIITS